MEIKELHQTLHWRSISIIFFIVLLSSCASVRSHEKTFLNDEEMNLAGYKTDCFDHFLVYREGASGGMEIAETGGGCGCN